MRSKRYTGVCEINGETYTNIYPQIVPNSLYQDVQLVLKANNLGSHSTAVMYLVTRYTTQLDTLVMPTRLTVFNKGDKTLKTKMVLITIFLTIGLAIFYQFL